MKIIYIAYLHLFVCKSMMIGSLLKGPQQTVLISLTPQGCLRPGSKFKSSGLTSESMFIGRPWNVDSSFHTISNISAQKFNACR